MNDEESTELTAPSYDFTNCRTRADPEGPIHDQDVLAAILITYGNYARMSELLGRPRERVRKHVEKNLYIFDYLLECRQAIVDKAEENVFDAVKGGNYDASKFLLTTLGKDRGYSSRQEQVGKDGGPIDVAAKPTREIAKAFARLLDKSKSEGKDFGIVIDA